MSFPIRVVKLGGSLFDLPDLPDRLTNWLKQNEPGVTILLSGGGEWVRLLRAWQTRYGASDPLAHDLAIQLMGVTLRFVSAWLPHWPVIDDLDWLRSWAPRMREACRDSVRHDPMPTFSGALFDCRAWLASHREIPKTWQMTSDAIAAALACELAAHELVLLKSTTPPPSTRRGEWFSHGLVDAAFAAWSLQLQRVRFVNLRADPWTELLDA